MDAFLIQGGRILNGEVKISGSKNASLPIIAATILTDDDVVLRNVPNLSDVRTMFKLLSNIGKIIEKRDGDIIIRQSNNISTVAPYDLVKTMRASVLVLGALIGKYHKARVSFPGGCAIGARPIDQHLKGFEALGVRIDIEEGYIIANVDRLKGARIVFDLPTVGGTENVLMAAVMSEGETIIENAAMEPEVVDLANFLNKMGAKIEGAGTPVIRVDGVKQLRGVEYSIIPDRIEAATYFIAGAMAGGEVVVDSVIPEHIDAVLKKVAESEVEFKVEGSRVIVFGGKRPRGIQVKTRPYPGFPTDVQAQIMSMLTVAEGTSVIVENIFENRFMHVNELNRMGAKIKVEDRTAIVEGVEKLKGAPVMASDLRASASLVLAGLIAEGETKISRIYHLDRGYEQMEKKLNKLGASVKRIKE